MIDSKLKHLLKDVIGPLTHVPLCSPKWGLNKHAISPYFQSSVWLLFTISNDFLWKSELNPKIWAENSENSNKTGDFIDILLQ